MPALYTPFFLFVLLFVSCISGSPCGELIGHWTTHEGQELVFQPNGAALWLTKFGSQYDTIRMKYRLDCSSQPATLDLTDFQNGPHQGKTLFGIFDWSSDSSFRFRYESGSQASDRPQEFDVEQTQKFTALPQ